MVEAKKKIKADNGFVSFSDIYIQELVEPWLVWLSGLSTSLQTKGPLVQFPVRAYAWAAGQVPSRGRVRGNHTLMFLSLSSLLSKNK